MPAVQRINQSLEPVYEQLEWIKGKSPSVKARKQAGKALLQFEIGEDYAEKAITFHELKESQTEEGTNSKHSQRNQRFQNQES
jgi:hypothetical protein